MDWKEEYIVQEILDSLSQFPQCLKFSPFSLVLSFKTDFVCLWLGHVTLTEKFGKNHKDFSRQIKLYQSSIVT